MGFRSHVRHFRGAILGLLRPSEAWCFAPGRWFFPWCFPLWGPDVKVAKIHGSSKRKREPKASASFSMGFRSHVRHFRGAILGLFRPSEAWCFAPGRWFFPWCFPIWRPDVKVAKIHGSSKRKKEPKASFSMGFRSHVRHFRGAILGLLRSSEAWCFAPGRLFFPWSSPIWPPDVKVAKIHSSRKRKKEPKASFSMGFRSHVRHFRGAILGLLRPSEAWCFAPGRWFFPWCFPIWGPEAKIHGSSKRKREPKASFSMGFRSHVRHFRGAILGHQQQQQSKLDSIGLDFEQDKRGYKRGYKRWYERISSRISEGTFRPPGTSYCDWFCVIFGTKLGVLLFRLCLEKGVWLLLLVSCFRRWAAPATAAVAAAAAAAAISSHQQQQQQQSKLDSIGLDFEQEKRGKERI